MHEELSIISYICNMNTMKVTLYEHAADLPELPQDNYFHSPQLMALCEQTPRHKPLMAVAYGADGRVEGHLLCITRYRASWFPPYLYAHTRIYGNNGCSAELFGQLMEAVTERLQYRVLYLEVSNLSEKMFAYRQLRKLSYFPVRWMSIHNSLHSRTPQERIGKRQLHRINLAVKRGAVTKEVTTEQEFKAFSRLLRRHNWLKPRRFIPDDRFFRGMMAQGRCKIYITSVRDKVIGCSVCTFSGNDAYLWYSASRRKSYAKYHPNAVTFWYTICDAHRQGYDHVRFMDVGLPFRHNPYRDFILRFGGKEVSTYRWFRISLRVINRLASWLWRE